MRGGIAERGGVRVGHRIIEINNQSVVAVPHEKIVNLLATSVGEVNKVDFFKNLVFSAIAEESALLASAGVNIPWLQGLVNVAVRYVPRAPSLVQISTSHEPFLIPGRDRHLLARRSTTGRYYCQYNTNPTILLNLKLFKLFCRY